jgi:hypothetical protein
MNKTVVFVTGILADSIVEYEWPRECLTVAFAADGGDRQKNRGMGSTLEIPVA